MSTLCLVTGANGHLGNNLVRTLIQKQLRVRAGVRNLKHTQPFEGLDCELVYAEMTDFKVMVKALENVDILFHVAAVFKHWSKKPDEEIIQPNVLGTEVVMKAARQAGVKKVIYVSSVAAVGHNSTKLDETCWNDEHKNAYYRSKILSERKAVELAERYQLPLIRVLPSAMIGPNLDRLTDTMAFIESIRSNNLLINPCFFFNFVDVRDVAEGIYKALEKGHDGERYILANEHCSSVTEIVELAKRLTPAQKVPPRVPKWLLYFLACVEELKAALTGKKAELIRSQVGLFYGVRQEYDITKAQRDLGYHPRSPEEAILNTLRYLDTKQPLYNSSKEPDHVSA